MLLDQSSARPGPVRHCPPVLPPKRSARSIPFSNFVGPDHKILVEVFDDPQRVGVSCYLSRAKTGGIKGAIGLAEDKADASVACRQVGPISLQSQVCRARKKRFPNAPRIFFKQVRVVRMVDPKRNALVYLVYSDRLIDGSPKNSVTAVPVPAN